MRRPDSKLEKIQSKETSGTSKLLEGFQALEFNDGGDPPRFIIPPEELNVEGRLCGRCRAFFPVRT
jgi:hypothetical protein